MVNLLALTLLACLLAIGVFRDPTWNVVADRLVYAFVGATLALELIALILVTYFAPNAEAILAHPNTLSVCTALGTLALIAARLVRAHGARTRLQAEMMTLLG